MQQQHNERETKQTHGTKEDIMSVRLLHIVYIVCTLQFVLHALVDSNNITSCGIPPCGAGCYFDVTNADGSGVGSCAVVPVGYFSPGDESLYPCPKGTYASQQGSEICTVCPIGTSTSTEGSDKCTPCDEGLYAAEPGLIECAKCNPSKYFGPGSTGIVRENDIDYCIDPNDNTFECGNSTLPCSGRCYIVGNISTKEDFAMRSCSIVPQGYFSPRDDELLYECPVGTYSLEGSNECTLCAPGSAAGLPKSASCQLCSEGTYASSFGATSCSDCNSSLYFGLGSTSVFRDDKNNITYCLKPTLQTSEYPSIAPSYGFSMLPSISSISSHPSSQQPSSGTVEITVQPTSIFDVITESTRSPEQQDDDDSRSFSPSEIVFNDTSTNTDGSREIPTHVRYILFFAIMLVMLYSISYRWCYRHRPMCCRSFEERRNHYRQSTNRTKAFARTPPAHGTMSSSPTFPVPKIISTTKIISQNSHVDDDEESEIGVYIEDDSVM